MTTIQPDAQRLQALQDESDRRHILAQKMISGGTPTPAAPSGELLADAVIWYDREETPEFVGHLYDNMAMIRITGSSERFGRYTTPLAAVSQAAPEQANPVQGDAIVKSKRIMALIDDYVEIQLVGAIGGDKSRNSRTAIRCALMDEFESRALAAPSGAPKQPEPLDFVKALGIATDVFDQYKVDQLKWWKRMDGTPILNDVAVRMAEAFVGAASTVQSAPVLPENEVELARLRDAAVKLLLAALTRCRFDDSISGRSKIANDAVEALAKLEQSSTAGAAKGGIDEPNGAVQALALPVAAAPEQKP